MNGNVIRTITIRGTSEGLDKLQGDLNKVAAAHKGVTVATEETEKSSLSFEQTLKRQALRLDEVARAQNNIERETKIAGRALKEGLIDQQRHAELLNLANQRYGTASKATAEFGKQTGLARHELINLGRQAQDVGVSLVSGQSPLMVLAQQGSQIADVFISSGKSVGSFFSQAIGWAGQFVTSTVGVITGITGIAAAALYMGSSFASAQRDIDKALSGMGGASGMTRGGINQIAQQASGLTMSTSEAREAATAFAATGRIYSDNILQATKLTRDFALAMGIDASTAAKTLAAALLDPSKGVIDLNKNLGFLDATTLNYIRTLQSQGDLQGAQKAMMDAFNKSIQDQMQYVGLLTKGWEGTKTAFSSFVDDMGKGAARLLEAFTGIQAGGFSDEQRLAYARQTAEVLKTWPAPVQEFFKALYDADAEAAKLQSRLDAVGAEKQFNILTTDVDAFTRSMIPALAQIDMLKKGIADLQKLKLELADVGKQLTADQQNALDLAKENLVVAEKRRDIGRQEQNRNYTQISTNQLLLEGGEKNNRIVRERLGIERAESNTMEDVASTSNTAANSANQRATSNRQAAEAAEAEAYAMEMVARAAKRAEDAIYGFVPRLAGALGTQFYQSNQGGYSQFNPAGYTSTASGAGLMTNMMTELYGQGGFDPRTGEPNEQGFAKLAAGREKAFEARLAQSMTAAGGNLAAGVGGFIGQGNIFTGGEADPQRLQLLNRYIELMSPEQQISSIKGLMGQLQQAPQTLQTAEMTKQLGDKLTELTRATDENTNATSAMTDVLSPFYSSDPRRTHLGFRAFAEGGIMTQYGALPLKQYQGGGIATSPQVAVFGEGSTPEAYVPAPGGRIPVEMKTPANTNQRPVNVTINVMGNASAETVAALRQTSFQKAQQLRRMTG